MKTKFYLIAILIVMVIIVVTFTNCFSNLFQSRRYQEYNSRYQKILYKNGDQALEYRFGRSRSLRADHIFCSDNDDTLLVFIKKGKRGYLNLNTLKVEIAAVYDYAWQFDKESGLAAVSTGGKIGFIDTHGNFKIKPAYHFKINDLRYDEAFIFSSGECIVPEGDRRGLINIRGELLLPAIYDDISEAAGNSHFRVASLDQEYCLYDGQAKKIVIPLSRNKLSLTDDGIALLENTTPPVQYQLDWQLNRKEMLFDSVEHLLKDTQESSDDDYYNDENDEDGARSGFSKFTIAYKCGIIDDKTGLIVCPAIFDEIEYYSEGIFKVTAGEYEYLTDASGKAINVK